MEVQFTPDMQAKLDQLATATGRSRDQFIQDALAGYLVDLMEVRDTLDRRYDDIRSGKVKLLSSEEVLAHFGQKSAGRRSIAP